MGNALEIRAAREDDYGNFLRLVPELAVDDPLPDFDRWSSLVRPTMLLAEQGGEAVGYTYYRPFDGMVHLAHIVTAPSARRTGVGRALMAETIRRGKAAGATSLYLNVKPKNERAIALYRSFGFAPVARTWAFRMPWATIEAHTAPYVNDVRPLAASDDAEVERRHGLPAGLLSSQRKQPGRELHAIGLETFASFDPAFGGANPFAAASLDHVFSLLRALRPFARLEHDNIVLTIDDRPEQAEEMLAAGATFRFEIQRMSGPI